MNTEPRVPTPDSTDSMESLLASWRATLSARTGVALVAIGGLMVLFLVLSFLPRPAPDYVWIVAGFYGLGVLGLWLTWRWSRVRAIVMLAPFVLVAPVLFAGAGISPSAFLALTMASMLAGVLVGPRTAAGFIVASLVVIAIGATIVVNGEGMLGATGTTDARLPQFWVRKTVLWFVMTSWMVFAVLWLTSHFEACLRSKDAALVCLRAEQVQRLDADRRVHETQLTLIESAKHEAIGRLAGGVAHDFNNALLVVMGWNELLRDEGLDPQRRRSGHAAITTASEGAAQLARQLLTIGRRQVAVPMPTLLEPLVREAASQLERVLPEDITVLVDARTVPPIMVDRAQMHQVLLNLALNARDAMQRGGKLSIALRPASGPSVEDLPAGLGWVELVLTDDGHGMDEATLTQAREPYFTTKEEGRGSGLGLASTQAIVDAAKGRMLIRSSPGRGTCVTIHLPVSADQPASEAPASVTPRADAVPGSRVVIVEDDSAALLLMAMALRSGGYEVLEARDGEAALELLERQTGSIELLCIDGVLPGAPAERVVEAFRLRHPGRPVLVCSGHIGSDRLRSLVEHGQLPLLAKPFTGRELLSRVGALAQAATSQGSRD